MSIGEGDLFEHDEAFDLETVILKRRCDACGKRWRRRVSRKSARYQRLCSQCRLLSDPQMPLELPSFEPGEC